MPVAPGFKLDPTYAAKSQADLIRVYSGGVEVPPMRISVPTSGVYAEAIMGVCNACEKKDDSRFWRFEESPCGDEPTPIVPPSTESRRTDPGNLSTKDLAAPIIAMQTAPSAPDPAGIASALQVLGTSNLFRDITGLSDTQKAALASFQSSLQAAQEFGKQASNLSMASLGKQAQTTANSDRILQSIDSAQQSGHITNEQAAGLKQQAIKQMIGSTGQPIPTDLSTIEQAKAKGLITTDQANSLTASALSRLTGGSSGDSRESEMGLADVVRSAISADQSSVSFTRSGDTESMFVEKFDKADTMGTDGISTSATMCRRKDEGGLGGGDGLFPWLLRVDIKGPARRDKLAYVQWIKGTITLKGAGSASGTYEIIKEFDMGEIAKKIAKSDKPREEYGWTEDLKKDQKSGLQMVEDNRFIASVEELPIGPDKHLVYTFIDAPGKVNLAFDSTIKDDDGKVMMRPDGKTKWFLKRVSWDVWIRHQLWDTRNKKVSAIIFKEDFHLTGDNDAIPGGVDSRKLIRQDGTTAPKCT